MTENLGITPEGWTQIQEQFKKGHPFEWPFKVLVERDSTRHLPIY